jgi:hypothetical protein
VGFAISLRENEYYSEHRAVSFLRN